MESFLTTLPPFVHQYINKYPPTECFSVLKDLICFAVLYSNDRERINLLSLHLLQKGADGSVHHRPYVASELVPPLTSTPSTAITSPIQSVHHLSPDSASKTISSPTLSATSQLQQHSEQHFGFDCKVIMEEPDVLDNDGDDGNIAARGALDETTLLPPADTSRKSTMPYTFPEWWAHPDSGSNDGSKDHVGKNIRRSASPIPTNEYQTTHNTLKRSTTTQEMNITNWIPLNITDNIKPNRNHTTSRPVSLYNPTIPDLRSYLGKTEQAGNKELQSLQENGQSKVSKHMSVPAASVCDPPSSAIAPSLSKSKQIDRISRSPSPRLLTKSISSKTTSTTNNKLSGTAAIPLSRSSSTRSTRSTASSSTVTTTAISSKSYRPGQTATVRARAEQAKQRQLQLEEEKRKQVASTLTSRTSLRLRQQAASGIDWQSIKKDRRKTMPANGFSS